MPKPIRNMGASVRDRLLALSKQRNQPFQLLLTRYVHERLLYRLSTTRYRDRFVLKGALLITTWFDAPHRPTRDLDVLAFGDADSQSIRKAFVEILSIPADDGVEFDRQSLRLEPIREGMEYGGLRLRTTATIAGAKIAVVVDIAFGDAVEPGLDEIDLPVLLDQPAPRLRAYSKETVIAEKFQAMVVLGRANSRLKDFYDIWMLSLDEKFTGGRLAKAIAATFERRKTPIPETLPDALTADFAADPAKQQQWRAFVRDVSGKTAPLGEVVRDLATFLMPHADRARRSPK